MNILPDLVTFNDGNPDAYGVVAYVLWTLNDGQKVSNLLMSKAKLGPLNYKGETVRNELSGAKFARRLNIWIIQNAGLQFRAHHHFLLRILIR